MCRMREFHSTSGCPSLQAVIKIARSAAGTPFRGAARKGRPHEDSSGTAPPEGSSRLACTRAHVPMADRQLVIEGEFRMARRLQAFLACWAFAMAFPALAAAQSAFTGTVKDASGAVLPGVTVEVIQSRPDRRHEVHRHRLRRPVPHHRSPARRLHRHLHPARIQTAAAGGGGAARRLHRHAERHPRGRRHRRSDHRDRRLTRPSTSRATRRSR